MKLSKDTLLFSILDEYPFMVERLESLSPLYARLRDPEMSAVMAKVATLEMASSLGGLEVRALMEAIRDEVRLRTGVELELSGEEGTEEGEGNRTDLRDIIKELHEGRSVDEVKDRFLALARKVDGSQIAKMEQELMEEGIPQEEIKRLCDVHVEVFRSSLDTNPEVQVPPGHPLDTFMKENRALEALLEALGPLLVHDRTLEPLQVTEREDRIFGLLDSISQVEFHYLRKENQLFPLLEARGVKGPSQVMWSLHDDIRRMVKDTRAVIERNGVPRALTSLKELSRVLTDMIYKEEKVLFPMAMEKLSSADWARVRKGEEEIGYAWVRPSEGYSSEEVPQPSDHGAGPSIRLSEGSLTREQLDALLRTLPLDLSFVDENDRVLYYSATEERTFPRSPAVIGREVRNCHPPKSVHVVQRILDGFREGRKDPAEFWIELHGRFLHIRYFPVRSDEGRYLGCLEVTQDITGIRQITGEKRLLDWN